MDQYLGAVDEIQRRSECATTSEDQSKAKKLRQISMARLGDEFRIILSSLTTLIGICLGTDITSSSTCSSTITTDASLSYGDYDDIDYYYAESEHGTKIKEAIGDLRSIAQQMNSAGHLHECVKVYKSVRKSFLDASLRGLGVDKLSINEVPRLEWGVLEMKIGQFIRAAQICIRILFPSEKRLCEHIFEGLGNGSAIANACFTEIVKDRTIQLFNFAEGIARSRRPPQRLFKILVIHNTFSSLLPYIDAAFRSRSSRSVFVHATAILPRLAEAARAILLGFENDVLYELINFMDHKGGVHSSTTYAVNYIIQMSNFKEILTELIKSMPSEEENRRYYGDLTTVVDNDILLEEIAQFERERTPLPAHLIWIIHILQLKLKIKSKSYNDPSLAHLFMMNNVHYVVQKIQGSPVLQEMIGEDYVEKLTQFVEQAVTAYRTSTWEPIFHCLRIEGPNKSGKKISLEQRLKTFNAMFKEVYRTQATWFVADLRLRQELRISILKELIPAYSSFIIYIEKESIGASWSFPRWIRKVFSIENQPAEIVIPVLDSKYSVEELKIAVSNLFEGKPYTRT